MYILAPPRYSNPVGGFQIKCELADAVRHHQSNIARKPVQADR